MFKKLIMLVVAFVGLSTFGYSATTRAPQAFSDLNSYGPKLPMVRSDENLTSATMAAGAFVITGQPTAADTITVGKGGAFVDKTFVFYANGGSYSAPDANHIGIEIKATAALTCDAVATAINAQGTLNDYILAMSATGRNPDEVLIVSLTDGADGNTITLADTGSVISEKGGTEIVFAGQVTAADSVTVTQSGIFTAQTFDFYANGGSYGGSNTGVEMGTSLNETMNNLAAAIKANTTLAPYVADAAVLTTSDKVRITYRGAAVGSNVIATLTESGTNTSISGYRLLGGQSLKSAQWDGQLIFGSLYGDPSGSKRLFIFYGAEGTTDPAEGSWIPLTEARTFSTTYHDAVTNVTSVPTTALDVGSAVSTKSTAVEYGNGFIHKTVLTLTLTGQLTLADGDHGTGVKVYDFPAGHIVVVGAEVAGVTTTGAGQTGTFPMAVGTAVGADDATLTSTEANVIPSIAVTQGTAQSWNNTSTAVLVSTAGPTTPVDLYVNCSSADANIGAAGSIHTVTGTLVVVWQNVGDLY